MSIQVPFLNAQVAVECSLLNLLIEQNIIWGGAGKGLEEWLRILSTVQPKNPEKAKEFLGIQDKPQSEPLAADAAEDGQHDGHQTWGAKD